jgi:hypothetical protein
MSVIEMLRQLLKRGLPPPDRQPRRSERILEKLGGGGMGELVQWSYQ